MPRATTWPIRGGPDSVLSALAPHSIIFVRDGAVTTAQSVWLDYTASGAMALGGAGYTGEIGAGVAIYCPSATTIEVGDVFRNEGIQYLVEFVSPQGWTAVDGSTIKLAWASAKRARGV